MALSGEVIQFPRLNSGNDATQSAAVGEIAIVEKEAVAINFFIAPKVLDARS